MPMAAYPLLCQSPACGAAARYKVAACWSDGATAELKTYALCCPACLPRHFADAWRKQLACRLAPGETLDRPGVYELCRGTRDPSLLRVAELEAQLVASEEQT